MILCSDTLPPCSLAGLGLGGDLDAWHCGKVSKQRGARGGSEQVSCSVGSRVRGGHGSDGHEGQAVWLWAAGSRTGLGGGVTIIVVLFIVFILYLITVILSAI